MHYRCNFIIHCPMLLDVTYRVYAFGCMYFQIEYVISYGKLPCPENECPPWYVCLSVNFSVTASAYIITGDQYLWCGNAAFS